LRGESPCCIISFDPVEGRVKGEENVSTIQKKEKKNSWIPRKVQNEEWKEDPEKQEEEGALEADCVKWIRPLGKKSA